MYFVVGSWKKRCKMSQGRREVSASSQNSSPTCNACCGWSGWRVGSIEIINSPLTSAERLRRKNSGVASRGRKAGETDRQAAWQHGGQGQRHRRSTWVTHRGQWQGRQRSMWTIQEMHKTFMFMLCCCRKRNWKHETERWEREDHDRTGQLLTTEQVSWSWQNRSADHDRTGKLITTTR